MGQKGADYRELDAAIQDASVLELRRYDMRSVRASYLDNEGEFLVGVVRGEVVAMGGVRRVSATVAEVKRMRVHGSLSGSGLRPQDPHAP